MLPHKKIIKSKCYLTFIILLSLALGINACSKQQVLVPKVTPEPTHLRLVGKFVWFDLFTHDLESTTRFYEALFGWTFRDTVSGKKLVKTIMQEGVPIANAVHINPQKSNENESQWLSYMSVEDVDRATMLVEQNNGSIYIQPKNLPHRGRVAILTDPQGALFAIITTSDGDPPDVGVINNHWLGSELWTTNMDAAQKFYHLLAGYEQKLIKVGADSKYHLLVKDNQPRAGVVKIPWDDVKPNWVPYIAVEDVTPIADKVEEMGGKLLIEPDQKIREGRVAIIADPSGAVFAIQQFRETILEKKS
jgi:predicted enzyme related to lactoylglutathione lyase